MSSVNAPQPDGTGPAEVFDATVSQATAPISSDALPGPTPQESIIHAGVGNGIDPYLTYHYMVLTTITWSTNQNPGTRIFTIPIHPSTMHQWLAHLNKMYNIWDGGFDFGVKVAGTGFHAGGLMVARVPPNVDLETLQTPQDISAFEYKLIDPKCLEVEMQSVMDQRNVMYHYNPLNVLKPSSFGGYMVLMVSIPLNTSATGATQIAVQIYTKPSRNFAFQQLIPISPTVVNNADPQTLSQTLNFKIGAKRSLTNDSDLVKIKTYPKKSKAFLAVETVNAVKFDKDPMNGYFVPPLNPSADLKPKNLVSHKIQSQKASLNYDGQTPEGMMIIGYPKGDSELAWDEIVYKDVTLPLMEGIGIIMMTFKFAKATPDTYMTLTYYGNFAPVKPEDTEFTSQKQKFTIIYASHELGKWQNIAVSPDAFGEFKEDTEIFPQFTSQLTTFSIYQANNVYKFDYRNYAPPIEENIMVFVDEFGAENAQPRETRDELNYGAYTGFMNPRDSLIYELIDAEVNLPILPVKLHYDGYFTVPKSDLEIIYDLTKGKYLMKYLGRASEADPLVGSSGASKTYYTNHLISNTFTSSPAKMKKLR